MQSVFEMRQKWGRKLFWRGGSAGFRPGTHTTKLCSFSQGFMSRLCLLLQRGALAALQRTYHPALLWLWHLCTSPFVGSRHLVLACNRVPAQIPGEMPALGLPCGLCARLAGATLETVAALKPGWWRGARSCIHFTECYLDILWWLLRRGRDFCSSVAFLWDR